MLCSKSEVTLKYLLRWDPKQVIFNLKSKDHNQKDFSKLKLINEIFKYSDFFYIDNKLRSSDENRFIGATSYQEKDMAAFSLDLIGRVKSGKLFLVAIIANSSNVEM